MPACAGRVGNLENLVRSPKGSAEMEEMVKNAGREIDGFVRWRWVESDSETAWFVNPPVSELRACHIGRGYRAFAD